MEMGDTNAAGRKAAATCGCLLHGEGLGRRAVLGGLAGLGAIALAPRVAAAASGNYEAMVLYCIDPRMPRPTYRYMERLRLSGKYSQFVIAGAAVGVIAPSFAEWRRAFWDNLATSVELHHIRRLIAINHRDCAAAKIAYGDAALATPAAELETHRRVFAELRTELAQRQPGLAVQTLLMALDGRTQTVS